MARTYKETQVLDANVWLTNDGGEKFRITEKFENPGHFVVWGFHSEGSYPFESAETLADAKAIIDSKSLRAAA